MKCLIFKSKSTKSVYFWNGEKTVCVASETLNRTVGKVMRGLPDDILERVFTQELTGFYIGGAKYSVLTRATFNI